MSSVESILFIDANKYLDLYRTDQGKKLLGPLTEQAEYIFVTQQVVDEVERNKLVVAARHLRDKFKKLSLQTFNVPDHLSSDSDDKRDGLLKEMKEIIAKTKKVNQDAENLAKGFLEKIARSEDDVSTALVPVLANAVCHTDEELCRARLRKELGNPPGKSSNAIGDELSWEQILTHLDGKTRLWIISRDGDYGTEYGEKALLNSFLTKELKRRHPQVEVFLFTETVRGIEHFVETTGVKAEQRLTEEEARAIEVEESSLQPLDASREYLYRVDPSGLIGRMREVEQDLAFRHAYWDQAENRRRFWEQIEQSRMLVDRMEEQQKRWNQSQPP